MAYVPGYKNDIFISYPREADPEWVAELYKQLKRGLDGELANTFIYFDKDAYKAYQHRERMVSAAGESALFLPILLPAYVFEGKFTLKELDEFCKKCGDEDRIIIIEFSPVDKGRPQSLHGPNRNRFYDDNTRVPLKPGSDEYISKMRRMVEDIRDRLEELAAKYRKTVILAKTTPDLRGYCKRVREDLIASGFTVLPESEYPSERKSFEEKFKADLAKADLLVQLLGDPDEEEPTLAQFQFDEAVGAVGVPVLQWASPNINLSKVSDSWYKRILQQVDLKQLPKFQIEIKEKLKALSEPERTVGQPSSRQSLYIAADEVDKKYARTVKHIAIDLGYKDYAILEGPESFDDMTRYIQTAYAVVLLQGDAKPEFINNWLRSYKRLRENSRSHPQVEALVYAPCSIEQRNDDAPDVSFDGLIEVRPPEAFPQKDLEDALRRQPA